MELIIFSDKKHIATQKERTKQREIQLLLELDDEYLVSLAVNCCKKFEIEEEENARLNSLSSPIGDALKSLVKSLDDAKIAENEKQRRDQYRKQQKKQLVPLQLKSLSENEKREIIDKCWHRLLSPTTCVKIKMNGKRHIQAQLIAKLYSSSFIHVKERDVLVDQLTNDFHKTYPIAIQWLYHLAVKKDRSMYQDVLRIFLKNLRTKLSATEKIFTQFIINLPIISDDALKMVKKYAATERITLGLSTMRDIILYRPKHSKSCLQSLLEYTTDGDGDLQYGAEVSGPAIRCVVNKLYPKEKFQSTIEQFAIEHFEELQRTPQYFDPRIPQPPSNELQSDPKMFKAQQALYRENKLKWQRSETQELKRFLSNHSKLFFALCTQKPDLLKKFLEIYIKCRQNVQIAINQQSESLIKYFVKETSPIINLIETCPKGGELFVEEAARILTENATEKPSISLYNALVKSYFTNINGGNQVRIFLPILKYLDHNMVNKLLPALLGQLEKDLCKEAIGMILKATPKPAIEPSQLLVEIQCFAPTETSPHIEKIIALTNYCLGQGAYDKKALSAVLQQLVQKDPIPVLFMRTLIQTLLVYPDLTKFAMNILEILIFRNEIWKNKHLWDGFIRCCAMTQPESYAVLCKLGRPELKSVLIQKPELRAPLLEYALESTVRPYVLDVLKQDPASTKEDKKKIKIKEEKNIKKRYFLHLHLHLHSSHEILSYEILSYLLTNQQYTDHVMI